MWEAFEHAAFTQLDNLTAVLDVNRLGQTKATRHGWDTGAYAERLRAFGWHAIEIDGHDVVAIDKAYQEGGWHRRPPDRDHRFADPANPCNDHLIFSKGHASPLLYSVCTTRRAPSTSMSC